MTLAAGTKLGRYEVRSHIGTGGMGQVYLAQDTSELGRTVALKLLPAALATDPKWMRRFIREARTVSALNHPNVLTIYEFGQEESTRFMAMEYVDGANLREHLRNNRVNIHEVLDIAMQVAAALNAAHEAHVIHRDIKPDNIMVRRRDGLVKILDFGLAKAVKREDDNSDPATSVQLYTEPGTVLGTLNYMSPEQALALKTLDYRTDIWSLGAVLYEMITGRVPFQEKDLYKQIVAIQEETPPPLSNFVGHIPARLQEIVNKALAKNPDERYQTANDLLIDLRNLKRQLEVDAEDNRTALFNPGTGSPSEAPAVSGAISIPPAPSSAEYIVNQVKLHKRSAMGIGALLTVLVIGTLVWYLKPTAVALLTDKDTILLSEFENKTGEEVFDRTLRQGLSVQLQQSPFLDIFPEQRVRQTLQLMSLSPDEPVTRERAKEICQRQGLKAFIAGTIVKFERNYSITLEALNGQTGDAIALVQVEAEGKDQVLKALSRATTELREKLGESLSSIQKFDAKLEVTTSSLDALKEYALGRSEQDRGQSFKAIEFYKSATEKDPKFATAWLGLGLQYNNTGQPALAADCLARALNLIDHVSEDERSRIRHFYYQIVTGELDKAIEVQEAYVRDYPRESRGPGNLGNLYSISGQFAKAIEATSAAYKLNPQTTIWPGNLAEALIGVDRFDEARKVCDDALAKKLDSTSIRERLYTVAFVRGDGQKLAEQTAWASGRRDEYRSAYWQVQSAAFNGEWKKSQEQLARATEIALRADAKEVVATYTAEQSLRAAWLGLFKEAVFLGDEALKVEHNRNALTRAALAFALCGEAAKAQALIEELERDYPKDNLVNELWLPEIRAALELKKGNASGALELLEKTNRFESVGMFTPQTLRIIAYLGLKDSSKAASEARRILDHRGQGPMSVLWPMAHIWLARASVDADKSQAVKSYADFLMLWKNADPDLPVLVAARKESASLR